MNRTIPAVAVILAAFALAPRAQESPADEISRPFAPGGQVVMKLSAGEYRIQGIPDPEIRVRWRTRNPEDRQRTKVAVHVEGSAATIQTHGPRDNFQVTIELPARADLVVRLSAGDLDIRRIEGHKEIDVWAGDVRIAIGDPELYRRIDASVRAGELSVVPLRLTKGGLFRSVQTSGKGPYDLRVRLFAGDLKLVK
jgi:hypothetical protein